MSCKEAEPPNPFWLYGPVVKTHVECDSIVFEDTVLYDGD